MENFEDIKEGGIYDVRIVVEQKRDHSILACALSDAGETNKPRFVFYERTVSDFCQVTPENGTKNTESTSKYDPCRMFKKGDRVEVVKYKGRNGSMDTSVATLAVVIEDEEEDGWIYIQAKGSNKIDTIDPAYLELVTPVEELEPYRVGTGIDSQLLYCNNELFAEFEKEEDAKRVCDLLNAEHRKEQQQ